ncbi:aryl-sulfate sulfotransferase [bacterium]|nr:aryl-sulfate sulfotransferase [bacterium]
MRKPIHIALIFCWMLSASVTGASPDFIHYMHPRPGAQYVNPESCLLFRFSGEYRESRPTIRVQGSKSGFCIGTMTKSPEPATTIFRPDTPFEPCETIVVGISLANRTFSYSFSTSSTEPVRCSEPALVKAPRQEGTDPDLQVFGEPTILSNGVSVPSDFPYLNIRINEQPGEGKIILNRRNTESPFILIFNNDGTPFWYQRVPFNMREFKKQPSGLLTGFCIGQDPEPSFYIGMDSTYAVVDTFVTGPGYYVDEHELLLLPDGHYLIIAEERLSHVDMTQIVEGGNPDARIDVTHIQEMDEKDQVVWEWRSLDHFQFTDTDPRLVNIRNAYFDFAHINSIDIDEDGHLVISSRHLSEVTKIHRETGDIIWRLGGLNNEFTFVGDPLDGFSAQHDARCLGNGHYTLFDNGNGHNPPESRAVEYVLDTKAMTATLVWEHRESPRYFAGRFGNVQQLPNGNKLVNWGAAIYPKVSEIRPDGTKAYEMNFAMGSECYRVHREPWNAPALKPYLLVEPEPDGATLLFNQFGDPDVDYYKIYSGLSRNPVTLTDTSRHTLKKLTRFDENKIYYFRVTSVNKSGLESVYSNEESMLVKIVEPGENCVLNGDFSELNEFWDLVTTGDVQADGSVEEGSYHIAISQVPDNGQWTVSLGQMPVRIERMQSYILSFEAWAGEIMRIQPAVIQLSSGQDYARIGDMQVSTERKTYVYEFSPYSSIDNAALVFMISEKPGDVYFDQVSLRQVITRVDHETASIRPEKFSLGTNFPNPFNNATEIRFSVPVRSRLVFTVVDILGKRIRDFGQGIYERGSHSVRFRDPSVGSGMYFYEMRAMPLNGETGFVQRRKMIVLK